MNKRYARIVTVLLSAVLIGGAGLVYHDWRDSTVAVVLMAPLEMPATTNEPITPLPLTIALDSRKVDLGRALFSDPRLSDDGSIACAHCHDLSTGGGDHLSRSRGIGGQEGAVNAPTVFNSGFNFRQFLDGRAETLESQVDGPLQHPREMAGSWPKVIALLSGDPRYSRQFTAIYRDHIGAENIKDAIATFERSLITPNARFDQFLRGNHTILNEEEQDGYRLFKQIGCSSCHQGMNIGGNMYQKLGIMDDYFDNRGTLSEADRGRFNTTQREEDRYYFKVPPLRNVAVTAPYLHDGSARTLDEVVIIMARYQLGKTLASTEVSKLTAFLRTLTGEYLGKRLQ